MKNIIGLIGGSSGDSLNDKLVSRGYSVAIVGGKPDEPGMKEADYSLVEDLSNYGNILSFFNRLNIKKVIIGTGHIKAIELARYLEKNDIMTNINYEKSKLAKHKIQFKEELINIGVTTPDYLTLNRLEDLQYEEFIAKINFPCVVKSATDALQPVLVDTYSKLKYAIEKIEKTKTEILIEKYIRGNECTVAIAFDGKKINNLGVIYYSKSKEYKLEGFSDTYSNKISRSKEKELEKISINIVKELNITGVVRIDFILKDDQPYVLELNSVIITGYNGSAYPFFIKQDIDIAEIMVKNSLSILNK